MNGFVALVRRHRVAAVIAFLLVFPLLMPYQALAINILIFGLFAVGFNLLFGYTGLLSFGHAAFLGVGSYLTGIGMVHFAMPWGLAVLLGVASAAAVGVVMGYLAIRTRGIYFSMVTLALAQIVYYAFYKAERWTGGENGLRGIQVPSMEVLGVKLDFLDPVTKYYVILVFVAAALWFVSRLLASPFGAVIEAVRENEKRAAACGYDVARTKLLVFVVSAALCGLAGALRALHLSVVPIESLHYLLSGQAVMMCLLGGMGTFFGPFVGAGVFLTLEDVVTTLTRHWMAVVGAVFMVFVLFFPAGLWGSLMKRLENMSPQDAARRPPEGEHPALGNPRPGGTTSTPILEVEGISKRFGNFVALNRVSASFLPGKLSAIIGPNGAGKSTFFNVVSGAFPPSEGRLKFKGRDITGLAQHEFARIGIAKSFQITNIFKQLTAHENVRVAVQMRHSRYELLKPRAAMSDLAARAGALLERVGLAAHARRPASDLAHGQQRALEVAMALAAEPELLLMDEPTAGMSPEETLVMMDLITALAAERSVILVEHKMKLVMGICERLLVLHHGEFLAEGTPAEIKANEDVKRVYLGQA